MTRPRTRSTSSRSFTSARPSARATAAEEPSPRTGPGPKRRRALAKKRPPKTEAEQLAAKEARALSGKAVRYLRGLGHHLEPIVQIGKEGITEGVVTAMRAALLAHELVKVRVLTEAPVDRKVAGAELAERVGATLAQTLGRTLLLYKRHPNKPKIVIPR